MDCSIIPPDFFTSVGLPVPPSMPTPVEVRVEARRRSSDLLSQWDTLRKIVERHEDVIRKRWMKKTKTQRTSILLGAWPKMSAKHRPDFEALSKEGPQLKSRGTKFRDAYMFPYVNIEDLARGKSLLLFLNSRGRHHPNIFAHADLEAIHLGQVSGATMAVFLNQHTMFLEGETIDTYGKLVSWDDDDTAFNMMFKRLAHQPGEGLFILEIQQRILRFLNDCCRAILHDVDNNVLTSIQTPVKPEPSFVLNNSDWPTLASLGAEAPYRVPARIDFNRLKTIVDAKRSDAEDHVRGLREDPGYFADFMLDWSDHRQEKLLDTNGARHPILDKPLFWDRVLGNAVKEAYGSLLAWKIVSNQLTVLATLQKKYSTIISPRKPLPEDYTKALLTLQYTLDQLKKGPIANLKHGLAASPYFRSLFDREPQVSGSTMILLVSRHGSDSLFWMFSRLWDDDQLFLLRFPTVIDELEKVVQSDPKEKQKVSSWVARVFAELGLMARARHELDIYMPWAAGFENDMLDHKEAIQKEFAENLAPLAELDHHIKSAPFAKTGNPTGSTFNYPSEKRRTQQNVASMRSAEQNLDLFWKTVDSHYQRKTGKTLYLAFRHLLKDDSPLERTPEWVEPLKTLAEAKAVSIEEDAILLLSGLSINSLDTGTQTTPHQPRIKPKTRGEARAKATGSSEAPPEQTLTSSQDLPGEVTWVDFLFAMAATGFAPEKLYGSIWQFTPATLDVERSIQFHEPHPRAKIPFRNARRIGRRLTKAYGWHGGMFVLLTRE